MKRKAAIAVVAGLLIALVAGHHFLNRTDAKPEPDAPQLTQLGPYAPGMRLREAFESLPPAGGQRTALTLLEKNSDAWVARWRMLAATRETLDISYFILREDLFGAAFLGHLLKKTQNGARLRLLLDATGTRMSLYSPRGNDWLDTMASARNVKVKVFRPVANRWIEALLTANPVAAVASEHDKILVCDKRIGMIGGRNISTEYFVDPADLPTAFEDVDVILDSVQAARGLLAAFEVQYESKGARKLKPERLDLADNTEELLLAYSAMDAWLKDQPLDAASEKKIKALRLSWIADLAKYPGLRGALQRPIEPEAEAKVRVLDSRTRLEAQPDIIAEALQRLILSSRKRIIVQSPYLVLSEQALTILTAAGKRGVKIVVFTNSPISSDNALSQAFFLEQWPELLARVPNLRIFVTGERRTLHSKLMIFDDQVSVVGTYNLDPISMGINSEIVAAVWSHAFAKKVAAHPFIWIGRGPPQAYEYKIKRDARGMAIRGEDGKPIVAFGPENHAAPEEWRLIQLYWTMLRGAEKIPGFTPLF